MFELTEESRYFLCLLPTTMNKGIDGLSNLISSCTGLSPMSGDVYVFFSKNRRQVKLLRWDTDGFLLYQKRLSRGTFELPTYNSESGCYELSWDTFYFIIKGVDLAAVKYHSRFTYKPLRLGSI